MDLGASGNCRRPGRVLLDRSLRPRIPAGITRPCAGGLFYRDRDRGSLCGLCDDVVTDDIGAENRDDKQDAGFITAQKKGTWCAIPAPHELGITDNGYITMKTNGTMRFPGPTAQSCGRCVTRGSGGTCSFAGR